MSFRSYLGSGRKTVNSQGYSIFLVTGANQDARKLLFTDSVNTNTGYFTPTEKPKGSRFRQLSCFGWSWGEWWKFYKILEEEKTELLPKNTAKHEQEHNLTDISFVIRSTSLFFNEYLRRRETICDFQARAIARRRKAWFYFRMSGIIFRAKHSWTRLCMSRPLFVGSYLRVAWWAVG